MEIKRLSLIRFAVLAALLCFAALITFAMNPLSAEARANGHPVAVTLGDSYSSGEGTEPFYGQSSSSKYSDPDWLGHRSELAWPGKLVIDGITLNTIKDAGWVFEAASGAETKHFWSTHRKSYNGAQTGTEYLRAQRSAFSGITKGTCDVVTITIGGNDLGFSDIVKAGALDINCMGTGWLNFGDMDEEIAKAKQKLYSETLPDMKEYYEAVREKVGPDTVILVAGYPRLFSNKGGGEEEIGPFDITLIDSGEAEDINAACDLLAEETKALIESMGDPNLHYVDVRSAFSGHQAYDSNAYINGIIRSPQTQDLDQKKTSKSILGHDVSTYVSQYSIHPNAQGQIAYAKPVQDALDKYVNKVPFTVTYNIANPTNPSDKTTFTSSLARVSEGRLAKPDDIPKNYEFDYWSTNQTGTGTKYLANQVIKGEGNLTLYAQWKQVSTTFTYDLNGGHDESGRTSFDEDHDYGSYVAIHSGQGISRKGYVLEGWGTSSTGLGTPYTFGEGVKANQNLTLYAQWRSLLFEPQWNIKVLNIDAKSFTQSAAVYVSLLRGTSPASSSDAEVVPGYNKAIRCELTPAHIGYDAQFSASLNQASPTEDTWYYWLRVDGVEVNGMYYDYGSDDQITTTTPAFYDFENGTNDESYNLNFNIARAKVPCVEFDTLGGSLNGEPSVLEFLTNGDMISGYTISAATIASYVPTRSGYHFVGWFEDFYSTDPIDTDISGITQGKTLYAHWRVDQYPPDSPVVLSTKATSVTLKAAANTEYALISDDLVVDENTQWHAASPGATSITFSGLTPMSTYYFVSRFAGLADKMPSPASMPIMAATRGKKDIELTDDTTVTTIKNIVYSGEEQSLLQAPEKLPEGCVGIQYSSNGKIWTSRALSACEAGNYNLMAYVRYVADEDHNDLVTIRNESAMIRKAPLSVAVNDASVECGQPLPDFQVNITGFVNGETQDCLQGTLKFSCNYKGGATPGTFKIVPSGLSAKNYAISYTSGNLVVSKPASYKGDNSDNSSNTIDAESAEGQDLLLYAPSAQDDRSDELSADPHSELLVKAPVVVGMKVKAGGSVYKVTSNKKKTVSLIRARNEKVLNIPSTITIDDQAYRVATIASKAFSKAKETKVVKLYSPKLSINKKAFKTAKNLRTVVSFMNNKHSLISAVKALKAKDVKLVNYSLKSISKSVKRLAILQGVHLRERIFLSADENMADLADAALNKTLCAAW